MKQAADHIGAAPMSPLADTRTRLVIACVTVSSMALSVRAQDGLSTPEVFAAASRGSVEQFAEAVARAWTPVGVVLLAKDVRAKRNPLSHAGYSTKATSEATIAVFEARFPEYRIERGAGGVVIAPRTTGWCSRPLRHHLRSLTTGGEAFDVLYRIVRTWTDDGSPYVPPGIVGREGHRPDAYRMPVTVELTNSSLEHALNEVVRQVPGLGWAVRDVDLASTGQARQTADRPAAARGCNVALFDGVGWLETSWTLAVVAVPR